MPRLPPSFPITRSDPDTHRFRYSSLSQNMGDLDFIEIPEPPKPPKPPERDENGMLYGEDFYIYANIFGYTGDLHDRPTVYFSSDVEGGSLYLRKVARITQKYPTDPNNIGRGTVFTLGFYYCKNVLNVWSTVRPLNPRIILHEYYSDFVWSTDMFWTKDENKLKYLEHRSRTALTLANKTNRHLLARAIINQPNRKPSKE